MDILTTQILFNVWILGFNLTFSFVRLGPYASEWCLADVVSALFWPVTTPFLLFLYWNDNIMIRWKPATVNKPVVMAVCRVCKRPLIRDLKNGEVCPKCRK